MLVQLLKGLNVVLAVMLGRAGGVHVVLKRFTTNKECTLIKEDEVHH